MFISRSTILGIATAFAFTPFAAYAQTDTTAVSKPAAQVKPPAGATVGGFLQADWRSFLRDSANKYSNDIALRRVRLDLTGSVSPYVSYRLQTDFAASRLTLNDAYADISASPALRLRVGKAKVPLSLERAQATPALVFIEQGATLDIAPNYDVGAQLLGDLWEGIVSYNAGVFNGAPDGGSVETDVDDSKDIAGRFQFTPFARRKNFVLNGLTVGAGATHGTHHGLTATPQVATYRTGGQATFLSYLPTVVNNGTVDRLSAYAADYTGPFSLFGEWIRSHQELTSTSTATPPVVTSDALENRAYQVYGTFVLTGERASYRGIVPRRPFDPAKGSWGAVELAFRYDDFKADDAAVAPFVDLAKSATHAASCTVGVNWYLTSKVRALVNYQHTTFSHGAAGGSDRPAESVISTRLQTVF